MSEAKKQTTRISLAGFVCRWRSPQPAGESPKQRFFSLVESIQASVQPDLEAAEPGQWKAVRISAPGRYFLGFARR